MYCKLKNKCAALWNVRVCTSCSLSIWHPPRPWPMAQCFRCPFLLFPSDFFLSISVGFLFGKRSPDGGNRTWTASVNGVDRGSPLRYLSLCMHRWHSLQGVRKANRHIYYELFIANLAYVRCDCRWVGSHIFQRLQQRIRQHAPSQIWKLLLLHHHSVQIPCTTIIR